MRIGIDGGSWSNQRGYGRFLREVVTALGKVGSEHRFVVFTDSEPTARQPWPSGFEPRLVELSRPVSESSGANSNRSSRDVLRMSYAVAREDLDLFFFPTVYSYFPLLRPLKAVVGVHDTIADDHPEYTFETGRNRRLWAAKVRAALWQADLCLTVSEYSRRAIERVWKFDPPRIRVVHEAAASVFHPPNPAYPREDFVLAVGGLSPNKNLSRLIEAFAHSRNRSASTRLLLVGDYEQDLFKSSYEEIRARLDAEPSLPVELVGYLDDTALAQLYRRTRLFVMPSLDEGFGLPAIEAMASGAPCIVSRGHALEEVAGGAALLIDPHDEASIAEAIDQVLENDGLAQDLSRRALARAGDFSWEETAQGLLRLFEELST